MVYVIQTALELGFMYALVAMALFLSYRILDIADLTTDSGFVLGAAVSVTVAAAGHPFLAILAAMAAGSCAGFVTAFLQTRLGVPSILAGIVTNTGLYTVNLMVMGWSSNVSLLKQSTLFTMMKETGIGGAWYKLILAAGITILVGLFLVWFLGTRIGLSIRATGDNADMVRASSVNPVFTITVGLCISNALTALSGSEDPERCSIPFDKDRDGFVMGEGAGVVILEDLEHAKARGAHILAEVVGYGATSDAYHITSPAEDGMGAATAMKWAVEESGAAMEDIMYINAHGTSTHHNDLFETKAIHEAFGSAAAHVAVNSTKSMIGHLLGAAGGVEFIVCVKSIQEGFIHQTVGTKETDEECDLNYVLGSPLEQEVNVAMSNSLGFGGHNATVLVRKYKG